MVPVKEPKGTKRKRQRYVPIQEAPQSIVRDSGLAIEEHKVGQGEQPQPGERVSVHPKNAESVNGETSFLVPGNREVHGIDTRARQAPRWRNHLLCDRFWTHGAGEHYDRVVDDMRVVTPPVDA